MSRMPKLSDYYKQQVVLPNIQKNYQNQLMDLVWLNKAYALMLVKQNLMTPADCKKISDGHDELLKHLKPEDMDGGKHDLFFNIEFQVASIIGEDTICKLHIGRSRNDIYYTITRMEIRKSLHMIMDQVIHLQNALLSCAYENTETVIPYYSYGQPAQPGTLAHYYLTVVHHLQRDFQRLREAYKNTNRSPVGCAACSGTSFPIDREQICQTLGFDEVIENTLDAVASMDFLLESESAMALMLTFLSKAAADMFFWASDESRMLSFGAEIATGSSIMPQKKNPAGIESIRSKSSHAAALLMDGLTAQRSTSVFPVRDNFEMTYLYWENVEETCKVLGLFAEVLNYTAVKKQTAYDRTRNSFTGASAMAEYLSQQYGVPFSRTHHVVGGMIKKLMAADRLDVSNMTGNLLRETAMETLGIDLTMTDAEISRVLDPFWGLDAKGNGGTPKAEDTIQMLEQAKKQIRDNVSWLQKAVQQLETAQSGMQMEIARMDGEL